MPAWACVMVVPVRTLAITRIQLFCGPVSQLAPGNTCGANIIGMYTSGRDPMRVPPKPPGAMPTMVTD